jgi:hypothetical protein
LIHSIGIFGLRSIFRIREIFVAVRIGEVAPPESDPQVSLGYIDTLDYEEGRAFGLVAFGVAEAENPATILPLGKTDGPRAGDATLIL